MALTTDQTAFFRRKLGTGVDLTDIETRLTRLEGDAFAVVVEVLEERLSTLISSPASFVVPGEYSQDTRDNIKATQAALYEARSDLLAGEDVDENMVFIQAPYYSSPVVRVVGTEEMSARGYATGRGR